MASPRPSVAGIGRGEGEPRCERAPDTRQDRPLPSEETRPRVYSANALLQGADREEPRAPWFPALLTVRKLNRIPNWRPGRLFTCENMFAEAFLMRLCLQMVSITWRRPLSLGSHGLL